MVKHIVLYTLKEGVDKEEAVKLIASKRFVFPCAFDPVRILTPSEKVTSASSILRKFRIFILLHSIVPIPFAKFYI